MRVSTFTVRLALVTGAALAVAACGSRPATTNTAVNAASVANDLSAPMNDASAVETMGNAATAPAPANVSDAADTAPVPPPSGNTQVQSNVAGM